MTYLLIDDNMMEHRKIVRLSGDALRSHLRGMTYSARMLSDGFVPQEIAAEIATPEVLAELTRGKDAVWTKVRRGYLIPNYLEWNPSRAKVESRRKARSQAGKHGAQARWDDGKRHGTCHDHVHAPIQSPRLLSLPNPEVPPVADIGLLLKKGSETGKGQAAQRLLDELPNATQGTAGRFASLLDRGAQESDFGYALDEFREKRGGWRNPAAMVCGIIERRLEERRATA